jgi:hypothetical protein
LGDTDARWEFVHIDLLGVSWEDEVNLRQEQKTEKRSKGKKETWHDLVGL